MGEEEKKKKKKEKKGEKSRGGEAGTSPKAVSMTTAGVHMPHGIGIQFKSSADITTWLVLLVLKILFKTNLHDQNE